MKKQFKLIKDKNSFQIHWDKKSINEKRDDDGNKFLEIEGYASTKDKDRGHDIVEPKAFENALATYMTNPVVLLQHKHDKPIGVVTEASIDNKGLYIKANITEDTDGVMSAIKNWVLRTFSIGYGLKEGDYEVEETVDENWKYDYTTTIKNLELYEISVVSVPMNAYALMKSIEDCFEVKEVEEEATEEAEEIEGTSIDWEVTIEHWEEATEEDPEEETLEGNVTIEDKKEVEEETAEEDPKAEEDTEEEVEDETEEVEEKQEEKAVDTVEENNENAEEVTEEPEAKEEEKIEEPVTEEKEVAENANIEETKVEEVSGNEAETPTDDWKADETSSSEEVETKSIEGSSEKTFSVDEKAIEERLEKKFEAKLVENTKKVEDLTKELEQTKAVLKSAIEVLKGMDAAVRNTVIKTGATYSRVAKKKSAWGEVISKAQNSL